MAIGPAEARRGQGIPRARQQPDMGGFFGRAQAGDMRIELLLDGLTLGFGQRAVLTQHIHERLLGLLEPRVEAIPKA